MRSEGRRYDAFYLSEVWISLETVASEAETASLVHSLFTRGYLQHVQ